MSYSNFKDPIGLFKRMLFSGNKTAYFVLAREMLKKLIVPIDLMLQGHEKKILGKSEKTTSNHPIILILGGSRNGTTLLYQTLVNHLPVSYITNFNSLFLKSPITAYKLFNRFVPKANSNYDNYYGSVKGFGGPNDAFGLWNRWFGSDRNRINKKITPKERTEMKRFFNAFTGVTKRPFLCKNNRNSLYASTIDSTLENVFFVEIYRNPIYVAQSLILSRRMVQGTNKIGWGLLSENLKESDDELAYIDDICLQVYRVNKAIEKEREKIDKKKYIRVSYEDFCENPADLIQIIGLKALEYSIDYSLLSHLKFSSKSNSQRLTDEEFKRIQSCFDKLLQTEKQMENTLVPKKDEPLILD